MGSEVLNPMELCEVTPPFNPCFPSKMIRWQRCTKCAFVKKRDVDSHCSLCARWDEIFAAIDRWVLSEEWWAKKTVKNYRLPGMVLAIETPDDDWAGLQRDIDLKFVTDKVSIEELISTSSLHRIAFYEAMKETTVPYLITPEELGRCLRAVGGPSTNVTYADSDLPPGGSGHNNALYITVGYKGQHIPKALVDTGVCANVMSMKTARNLGFKDARDERIKPTNFSARGFNGSVQPAEGFVDLEVSVGNVPCKVGFYLMDLPSDINLILGRPFIHGLRAVPSSCHQKLRFPFGGAVVSVDGDY